MRRLPHLAALAAAATLGTFPATAAGDIRVDANGPSKGIVIVAHPGGFAMGNAATSLPLAQRIAHAGYDALSLDYPLWDYRAAVKYTRHAALRARHTHRHIYIIGESAGGALAAALAARGDVDAAVAVGAPTDFLRWNPSDTYWTYLRMNTRARRLASPARALKRAHRAAPLLLYHSPQDEIVPFSQSKRLARATDAPLRRLHGPHLADAHYLRGALRWLARLTS